MSLSYDDNISPIDSSNEGTSAADMDDGAVDIMSPEQIAAMLGGGLDEDVGADSAESSDGAGSDDYPQPRLGMLSSEEVDVLGEVGNICMGAVATTMYTLLDRRVSITTPRVSVYDSKDVLSLYKIPFVVVAVDFVEGITGNNLLVLKVTDAALITDLLMGGEGNVSDDVELDEMHLSAMSEIMNQMMGASATALSKLIHESVNISTPRSINVAANSDVTDMLNGSEMVTKISFDMEIEGLLKSELIQLIPYEQSRELVRAFLKIGGFTDEQNGALSSDDSASDAPETLSEGVLSMEDLDDLLSSLPSTDDPAPGPEPTAQQAPPMQQPYPPQQAPYPPQQPYAAPARPLVDVHQMQFQSFETSNFAGMGGGPRSADIVQNIPLQVTVELGKTRKEISEILGFGTGSIIVLDKVAGDPVEIVVNGKLIARGEVVVIEENYGVRITDVIS